MPNFDRSEIEAALDRMDELRAEASKAGDWMIWAQCLTEDAEFYDTIYGAYHGRQAIGEFVCQVHAPFPHVRYERDWALIDVDKGEVIFQQFMILPEPEGYDGAPFATDVWSRHRYGGDGLFSLKQDVTLSSDQAGANVRAWMKAGGKFAGPPMPAPDEVAPAAQVGKGR